MSLPAYHFHGSVTVILSKTAQNRLIKAATEAADGKIKGKRRKEKKKGDWVRRRRRYPLRLGKGMHRWSKREDKCDN